MSLLNSTRASCLAIALAIGATAVGPTFAQNGAPPATQRAPRSGGGGGGGGAGAATPSLENSMKAMNRTFKLIGRQLDDATKDESTLKAASELEAATAAAKGVLPPQLDELAGEAKAKAAADYRRMMLQSLKDTIELEEALIAGNRAGAKAAYAKIDQQMRDGHKAYRVEH